MPAKKLPLKDRTARIWSARVLALAFILPLLSLFSSCDFKRVENDLYYDVAVVPKNLDPQSASDETSVLLIASLFEGLVTLSPDQTIKPGAARSWTVSPDHLTYTFTLREDARWSNGDPLTAEDFVFAFRRLFDPDTNAPCAGDFYAIANGREIHSGALPTEELGVAALDDRTLEIRLAEEEPEFLFLLTTPAAMPCSEAFFYDTKGRYGLAQNKIMGNGPFYLSYWGDSTFRLRPNAEYWDRASVTATSVTLTIPEETALERFLAGSTSAVLASGRDAASFPVSDGYTLTENEGVVWGIFFNTSREPFSSPEIRRALFLSADFSPMEASLPAYLERAKAILPENTAVQGLNYRKEAGMDLMPALDLGEASSLYRSGAASLQKGVSGARLIVPEGYGHEEYFAYLSQIWQRDLGLYLTLEVLSPDDFSQRMEAGDYECAFVQVKGEPDDPAVILSAFGLKDPDYLSLLSQAAESTDPSQAAALYKAAEQALLDTALFLPFYYETEFFVLAPGVSGVVYDFHQGLPDFRAGECQ